jgi:hypothetical protein
VSGARSTYDPAWARAFCERVATAKAVYRICQEPGMPSSKAVYGWLRREPAFVAMYGAAKRRAAKALQLQVMTVVDRTLDGLPDRAAFRSAQRQAARLEGQVALLQPKTYR